MLTQEQFIAKMQLTPEQMEEVGLIVKPCNGFHTDKTRLICDGWQLDFIVPGKYLPSAPGSMTGMVSILSSPVQGNRLR